MTQFPLATGLLLCIFLTQTAFGQAEKKEFALERLINQYVSAYEFSFDNQFKLAAYAELKGHYDEQARGFVLPFGNLGMLTFYANNCLLRTYQNRVYYLDRGASNSQQAYAFNYALVDIFERIDLLSSYGAQQERIHFVNKWLARKNMEPFDKIFTRHLFLKYGRFDPHTNRVEFHTDWLPADSATDETGGQRLVAYKSNSPLRLILDSTNLRGYYIRIGGYVYVEDVKREIDFASGEEYTYNGSAFKLFIQKMMTRSAQYIAEPTHDEPVFASVSVKARSATEPRRAISGSPGVSRGTAEPTSEAKPAAVATAKPQTVSTQKPLYDNYSWIPMMLGILQSNDVSISDPDVIIYFIDQPFFPKLYEMLPVSEKLKIDQH